MNKRIAHIIFVAACSVAAFTLSRLRNTTPARGQLIDKLYLAATKLGFRGTSDGVARALQVAFLSGLLSVRCRLHARSAPKPHARLDFAWRFGRATPESQIQEMRLLREAPSPAICHVQKAEAEQQVASQTNSFDPEAQSENKLEACTAETEASGDDAEAQVLAKPLIKRRRRLSMAAPGKFSENRAALDELDTNQL